MDENAAAYVGDVAMKSHIQISDPDRLNVTADTMVYSMQLSSYAGSFTLLAGDGGPVLIDEFSNISAFLRHFGPSIIVVTHKTVR